MKKVLNEQQKLAAKERREKFAKIYRDIANLPADERVSLASRMLCTTCEGHTLSPANQMLVAYQFPQSTMVGGFHQWRKIGRCVRKGEHGISIWIPRAEPKDENKQPGEMSAKDLQSPGFFVGTIFDISQTDQIQKE